MAVDGRGSDSQRRFYDLLKEIYPIYDVVYEYAIGEIEQRLDLFIPVLGIAVEYNGIQHYEPVDKFGGIINFHNTIKRDKLKTKKCKENNCNIFFVKYNYNENDYNSLIYNIKDIIDTHNNQKEDFVEIKQ